ncbi:hypothetical protein NPIL_151131 [Nephila pilipes]|uniref:Uncharacterized protein n=1 Tax=Nephila pilipes TaxID=299642 RepID=A0A8X6QI38_NEPPI|nr:hypothetical protein NPIL_151131 [Nephila pilipes]
MPEATLNYLLISPNILRSRRNVCQWIENGSWPKNSLFRTKLDPVELSNLGTCRTWKDCATCMKKVNVDYRDYPQITLSIFLQTAALSQHN